MRDYSKVTPRFWVGKTGRKLRGDPNAITIALYLITGPHSNMAGIYYLPISYIVGDTGIPSEGVAKALDKLTALGFCSYDQDAELIWVHNMVKIQIADKLKPGDNNTVALIKTYDSLPESRLLSIFYDKYSVTHSLPYRRGLDSPLPRAFISQEQEQEQEQEQDQEQKQDNSAPRSIERNAVPVDLYLTYPCNGKVSEYHLSMAQVNEWSMLYQGLDVAAECKKALAWIGANPSKRKTHRGMPSFLVGWLGRANDRGGRGGQSHGIKPIEDTIAENEAMFARLRERGLME